MKTLYANGCSMTFGAELGGDILNENNECLREINPKYREEHAWPRVLANSLNMTCINDAEEGSSNNKIFRKTMNWTAEYLMNDGNPRDLLVTIGWSNPNRKEYKLNGEWITILPNWTPKDKNIKFLHEFHVQNFLDEQYDSIITLQYILSLQSWLKINQIPYLFCNTLPNVYKNDKSIKPTLFHVNKKRYFKINDYNYYMHEECIKYPMGPRNHPLEEGHKYWAKLLQDYIEQNGLLQHD